jgi:tRNA(Met) cytidine acetyltransferase
MRIAVHPALVRHGLGRRLLRALFQEARREGVDLLGASFGATPGLLAFWSAAGYDPVQLGLNRNAASGEHALVVLRRASRRGAVFLCTARKRLAGRLPVLLAGPLRGLDPATAAALLAVLPAPGAVDPGPDPEPDGIDALELQSFIAGHRTLEAALPVLASMLRQRLGSALRGGRLSLPEGALLAAAFMQLRPVGELVAPFQAAGRAALVVRLRVLMGRLLG